MLKRTIVVLIAIRLRHLLRNSRRIRIRGTQLDLHRGAIVAAPTPMSYAGRRAQDRATLCSGVIMLGPDDSG